MGNQKFHVYINEDAGTIQRMGRDALEALIAKSALPVECLYFLKAPDLFEKLKDNDSDAPILIGGGDGTIRSCASVMMEAQKPFGILPLGTMNLLANDLGIPVSIEEALHAYAKGCQVDAIDVGCVNDDIFLCCVGLGTMPETSKFREEHRSDSQPILIPRLTAYILKQMDRANHKKVKLSLDGKTKTIKTAALVISNNQYAPQLGWSEGNFKRLSLTDGVLGVYSAAPYSLWDKLCLLLLLQLGDWKKGNSLREWKCRALTIECSGSSVLLSLDGEAREFEPRLRLSIRPECLQVLLPKVLVDE